jgi:hypothetical protein
LVGPSPSILHMREACWILGSSTCAPAHRSDRWTFDCSLGLHLRDRSPTAGSHPAVTNLAALRRPRSRVTQPKLSRTSCLSPWVSRPSGDSAVGIRYSRACLTRLLPPVAFLRPSTDYSSDRVACLLSYRRHLWGSKNVNNLSVLSAFPRRLIRRHSLDRYAELEQADDRNHPQRNCCKRSNQMPPSDS